MVAFPAVKFVSGHDASSSFPVAIHCVPTTKPVDSGWKQWAEWGKVMQALEGLL